MSTNVISQFRHARGATLGLALGAISLALLAAPAAHAQLPTVNVIGVAPDGSTHTVDQYRWLVEQDKTYHVPVDGGGAATGEFDPNWDQLTDGLPGGETLAVGFHRSYMPVLAKGCVNMPAEAACKELTFADPDPDPSNVNHYYISVVPRSGYSIGGASFKDGDASVDVYVNQHPIPTAQISILIFHDNAPINNAPDLPGEDPANPGATDMSGFQIIVEDAGGRYGASAGIQSQDAFGNPLGTTYDALGNVTDFKPLITDSTGRLTIKNLAPGKYGIQAVPPAGDADLPPKGNFPGPEDIDQNGNGVLDSGGWQQTSTIEGTKVIDAWVKANEPPFFAEFGPAGFHVFIGFVKEFNEIPAGGGATITGQVVNQHLSRPPDYAFYNGGCFGHTTPWVGLNDLAVGIGNGIYAAPTDENCEFSIPNVPDGNYQVVFWDNNLDVVFAFKGISILGGVCNTPTGCNLGQVPVFQWFHRQEHFVYNDVNRNGLYDPDEVPILEQDVALRWRDGTVYQANVTDPWGLYAFDQVFPFFSWLVAEVGFPRFEATSLTAVVDNGGPIPFGATAAGIFPEDDVTFGGMTNPQDQTNPLDPECDPLDPAYTGLCDESNVDYRTDFGPVLTAGVQGFLGQTNAFQWGKRHYADGDNGGVSGIVFYAVTRAENDVRYAAAEVWEPGIPGVTVNLYDRFGETLINTTTTDSWDDSIPTGCKHGNGAAGPFSWSPNGTDFYTTDCYDGLRVFNQVRPAVFDGGYAFDAACGEMIDGVFEPVALVDGVCPVGMLSPMPVGDYVVEVIPPLGYEILKPEDKNVDFGDVYDPAPELLPPPCVGDPQLVPAVLTLFPDEGIPAPFAGTERPLCDRKLVNLSTGANAAADFFLFTEVPIAAHGVGFILDDTQNEFDPNSPQFGEKYAPPFVPVTIRDWTGRIINKTISDQYGRYNFLAPSTITANLPQPSGMSPNMLTTCMNDPGDDPTDPDPNWNQLYSTFCYTFQYMPGVTTYLDTPVVPVAAFTGPDQFPLDCEYGDGTPRIYSVDVTTNGVGGGPYIPTVEDPPASGIWVTAGEQTITITSMGSTSVQNPNYCNPAAGACPDGADTSNMFVDRDYGFGTSGTVTLGELGPLSCTGPLGVGAWDPDTLECTVPASTPVSARAVANQLMVTRTDVIPAGISTVAGVTVQTGLRQNANAIAVGPPTGGLLDQTIQNAIDLAGANDLLLVKPGRYDELVVMWKPIQLQGYGEGSTLINAVKAPPEKLAIWRGLVDGLIAAGNIDLLPGQEVGAGAPEPVTLWTEEGAGVLVLARASGNDAFDGGGGNPPRNRGARIDGFTIRSADTGGGIIANGYADYLQISNNRLSNNLGFYGGGIRVGHPALTFEGPDGGLAYTDGDNDYVSIHHNQVVFNGNQNGAGGGISMCTGSDSYQITENWVCGNFSLSDGGGIGHVGSSDGLWVTVPNTGPQRDRVWTLTDIPLIADNTVIFNESFFQGATVSGGGLFISGGQPLVLGGLSPGAGNVQVIANLLQGNSAGAGDGGGVRLAMVNGQDVADNPDNAAKRNGNAGRNDPPPWNHVDLFNNLIVNNVAGLAGGGISLQDAVDVRVAHNSIANNDSLATAGEAFAPGSPNQSTPQPGAGIVTRSHSTALAALAGDAPIGDFSDPAWFADNILWHNRQFFFRVEEGIPGDPAAPGIWGLCPDIGATTGRCSESGDPCNPSDPVCTGGATDICNALACPGGNDPVYDDLDVIGAGCLSPTYSILTDLLEDDPDCSYNAGSNNLATDPLFVSSYVNGDRSSIAQPEIATGIQAPPAFDEGGNFIRPKFGPLALFYDCAGDPPVCDLVGDGDPGTLFGDYHIQGASDAIDEGLDLTGTFPELAVDFDGEPRVAPVDIGADEVQP